MRADRERTKRAGPAVLGLAVLAMGGCVFAAAGAGAGGGIYYSGRGVESIVTTPVDRTYSAAEQAFAQLGIHQTKTSTEQEGAIQALNASAQQLSETGHRLGEAVAKVRK